MALRPVRVRHTGFEQRGDARVVEPREDGGLALESREQFGRNDIGTQKFERNRRLLAALREQHDTHATATQFTDDLEVADSSGRGEHRLRK